MITHFKKSAIEAARLAGSELRARFRESSKRIVERFDHDIKLSDDEAIEELVISFLRSKFPDHGFHGEEGGDESSSQEFCWVIDPIDGTVNYFQGIPHFSTSIALFQNSKAILGVVYDPVAEDLFVVMAGSPPTLNGRQIATSNKEEFKDCVMSFGMGRRTGSGVISPEILSVVPKFRKARVFGSASLALSYVACGRLDAYMEEILHVWDIAAGVSLVEAAGGVAIVTELGESRRAIVAHNGRLPLASFDELLAI